MNMDLEVVGWGPIRCLAIFCIQLSTTSLENRFASK